MTGIFLKLGKTQAAIKNIMRRRIMTLKVRALYQGWNELIY